MLVKEMEQGEHGLCSHGSRVVTLMDSKGGRHALPCSLGIQLHGRRDCFKGLNSGKLFVNYCFRALFFEITIWSALDFTHFYNACGS